MINIIDIKVFFNYYLKMGNGRQNAPMLLEA
jgi:hypothetical protein